MHPTLLKLGPFTIHTYGLMIAIGFILAFEYFSNSARKKGIPHNKALDLAFYVLIAGIIGGRLWYVASNWDVYSRSLLDIFKVWEGGMVFFGGFIFGLIAALIYVRANKIDFFAAADSMAPAVALGHFFGRLGCFFAGCCYGKECSLPWAVTFTDKGSLAPLNIALHPTQLYSALANLFIFIFLVFYEKQGPGKGRVLFVYILLYASARFLIEFLRGDERGAFVFGLSPAQAVSLVAVAAVALLWSYLKKNERTNG